MIELVIGSTVIGAFIMFSFITGLHYGSKIKNNEQIDLPQIDPIKRVHEKVDELKNIKSNDKEKQIMEINMANIDAYDGTENGQRDFLE